MVAVTEVPLPQLVEQRLRLDEVPRVEALREPGVDGRKQCAGLGGAALVAKQACEARCGAQIERAGTLLAGDGKGVVIAGGGFISRTSRGPGGAEAHAPLSPEKAPLFMTNWELPARGVRAQLSSQNTASSHSGGRSQAKTEEGDES